MKCPKCGEDHVHIINETESHTEGYKAGNGCCGYLIFGPIGLICGACGLGEKNEKSRNFGVCDSCGHKYRI